MVVPAHELSWSLNLKLNLWQGSTVGLEELAAEREREKAVTPLVFFRASDLGSAGVMRCHCNVPLNVFVLTICSAPV